MTTGNDPLEGLIDKALESYTPREARMGLERRVLASVRAARSSRRSMRNCKPVWALAASVLLLAGIGILVWVDSSDPRVAVASRPAAEEVKPVRQGEPAVAVATRNTKLPSLARPHTATHPVQPEIGRPQPTREELLMAQLAAREPEVMETLAKSKPDLDAPIAIPPIPETSIAAVPVDTKPITVAPIQITSPD